MSIIIAALGAASFGLSAVSAQEEKGTVGQPETESEIRIRPNVQSQLQDDGVQGLIVDDTTTFIGRSFYDAFAIAWWDQLALLGRRPGEHGNFSIHERPTSRSGSQVWVEYDRQRLFQAFLPPALASIETTARRAAAVVARRFETLELQKLLFSNPDLAPDEL